MNEIKKKILTAKLADLSDHERRKLYKRAAEMKKLARRKARGPKPAPLREMDDYEAFERSEERRRASPLDEFVLRLLEEDEAKSLYHPAPGERVGLVISIDKARCDVLLDGRLEACELSPEMAAIQQTAIAVGDEAYVVDRQGALRVQGIAPRRTILSRPDPGNPNIERVVVANVDIVVLVVSLISPPLHPRLIDRYLIAIQRGGAKMAVCVNKLDLADGPTLEAELDKLKPYSLMGVPIIRCSAESGFGLDDLRGAVAGKLSAFVGHSGVGKSSLLNAIQPDLGLEVGEVSQGYGRGRHTTRRSTLWDLGGGTRIIDTPGVRSFGLHHLRREELPWYFPEFALAGRCRFRDCAHDHEPDCAVKAAVEAGSIDGERYRTYLRIRASG